MIKRKKVLIITYYWPPAGGGGVQRWLKFTKYIREFGWEPIIFTAKDNEIGVYDEHLAKQIPEGIEVIRQAIWEPYYYFKLLKGKKKGEKIYSGFINEKKSNSSSFTQKLAVFIRGNFFIPDARMLWIRPSYKNLRAYLKNHPVDAIISTGPPHSVHRIAYHLKKKIDVCWIADFRDPWTNIDFYKQLKLGPIADQIHKKMERQVLKKADHTVTVSASWLADFQKIAPQVNISLIHNGFDPADFKDKPHDLDTYFSICHIGSMNPDRNPKVLWKVLRHLADEVPGFTQKLRIRLIGKVDFSIIETIRSFGLETNLEKIDQLPHHEVIKEMQKAQVLLLPINNTPNAAGILPGKMYEYMGAARPILAIGPREKDAGQIIQDTKAGLIHDYDDFDGLLGTLKSFYAKFNAQKLEVNSSGINRFSRKSLAQKYAQLLNQVCAEQHHKSGK